MQIISDIPKERQTETRLNSSEFPACVPECSGNEKNIVDYCEQRTSTIYCGDQMFAGLANTDNNCCMNALLQTLFMTQNYEALLLRCQQKRVLKKAEDSIPYHLYKLFVDRHKNPQRIVPTHKFIQCLKLNHFNVGIQLDAEELFRSFFHLLQDQMKETGFIEAVNDLHMVTIEEFNSCLKCEHEFKQVEYMLTIPLSLCDTSGKSYETIANSLRDFFDYQLLDDDNKCHCDNCGEKTATMQYYRLLSCPQILCLQLKRFDLDPSLGTVVKNYDLMGFQEDLDLERFIDEPHSQKNKWQYKLLSKWTGTTSMMNVFGEQHGKMLKIHLDHPAAPHIFGINLKCKPLIFSFIRGWTDHFRNADIGCPSICESAPFFILLCIMLHSFTIDFQSLCSIKCFSDL
ncbi:hypothetical protein scyTo_0016816 [Scyliorhinus torazame]|uniref:USP domain-containing protein n=1 Tax=Scyliorhinus torazame TaxID=75743 RepID=A0A401PYZ6_SCYTO|nr:hypothetical protein [Scyliorhinus torazame]